MQIEQLISFSSETLEAIKRLAQQLGSEYPSLTDKDLQNIIISPNTFLFLAKDDEQNIAGMVTLIVYRIPYVKKAVIEDLVVDEAYRGLGMGSQLLQKVIDVASEKGASYVDLTSRPIRIESNKLYEKFGFIKRDTNVYRFMYDKREAKNSSA